MADKLLSPSGQYMPEMRKQSQASYMRPNRKTNGSGIQADETRICVVMVGLPARGKSLIASKSKPTCFSSERSIG